MTTDKAAGHESYTGCPRCGQALELSPGAHDEMTKAVKVERTRVLEIFDDYFHPGDDMYVDRCRAEIEAKP